MVVLLLLLFFLLLLSVLDEALEADFAFDFELSKAAKMLPVFTFIPARLSPRKGCKLQAARKGCARRRAAEDSDSAGYQENKRCGPQDLRLAS